MPIIPAMVGSLKQAKSETPISKITREKGLEVWLKW
jgi:hypothetical protein